ncbi:MAG: EscU/YscU/HrcU family type III secretion system export apparatus switch protein [Acidimicrobiales bacterium]|jgi:flagellar biosynthetic protein FlhB
MAGQQDKQSKTEKPTAKRKQDARHQGQVAKTPDVVTWLAVIAGTYIIPHTFDATYALVERLWFRIADSMANPSLPTDLSVAREAASGTLSALAPTLFAMVGVVLLTNLAQTRGLVTFTPLKPTFSHLNPLSGLKRLFSPTSLWEVAKQIVRVALLSLVAWETVRGLLPLVAGGSPLSTMAVASLVGSRAVSLTREVAAIGLVLALLDYIVQYRKTARQMRMTKEEVKEERKQSDGSPLMKGHIRRRQRQLARNRMLAAVAHADAVVVNPTHFAVALEYTRGDSAPKVIAKGSDFMALRIREAARASDVPIVEDPPLARALYAACQLEQEIPTELYEAVARLLTFIYSLKAGGRAIRIDGAPLKPAVPFLRPGHGLPIPTTAT